MHFSKGSAVVLYLTNPKERYWGTLSVLDNTGISIVGIDIASFDDWCRQVATNESLDFDLTAMFFPSSRLEKILLDQSSGPVQSMADRFQEVSGFSLEKYLESRKW